MDATVGMSLSRVEVTNADRYIQNCFAAGTLRTIDKSLTTLVN